MQHRNPKRERDRFLAYSAYTLALIDQSDRFAAHDSRD